MNPSNGMFLFLPRGTAASRCEIVVRQKAGATGMPPASGPGDGLGGPPGGLGCIPQATLRRCGARGVTFVYHPTAEGHGPDRGRVSNRADGVPAAAGAILPSPAWFG